MATGACADNADYEHAAQPVQLPAASTGGACQRLTVETEAKVNGAGGSSPTRQSIGKPGSSLPLTPRTNRSQNTVVVNAEPSMKNLGSTENAAGNTYLDNVLASEFCLISGRTDGGDITSQDTIEYSDSQSDGDELVRAASSVTLVNQRGIRGWCARVVERRCFTAFFLILTCYALFAPDLDTIHGNRQSLEGMLVMMTIAVILFIIEILLQIVGKPSYLFGAYFWLDLISLISLLPETYLFHMAASDQNLAAGRSTRLTRIIRVASRSSRAARLNRLSRIVRVAALMPKIQRLLGRGPKDQETDRLLDKKLVRVFQFVDEDLDGLITRAQCLQILTKLKDMESSARESRFWASRVPTAMVPDMLNRSDRSCTSFVKQMTSGRGGLSPGSPSAPEQTRQNGSSADNAATNRSNVRSFTEGARMEGTGSSQNRALGLRSNGLEMEGTMTFDQFRKVMLEDEIAPYIRRACRKQLRAGNSMTNLTARNSEYIGVKVALCVLLILFVLTLVESVATDISADWGLKAIDGIVRGQFPNVSTGDPISPILSNQVDVWTHKDRNWGDQRSLLYMDLNKMVFCNDMGDGTPCNADKAGATWGSRRSGLSHLDVMASHLDIRNQDLEWHRYPTFSDADITAEQLEDSVVSIALLDVTERNRSDALRSLITTIVVILIILIGITMLTRDLTFLSKNLLSPLVDLADDMESISRLQLAGVSGSNNMGESLMQGTSEVRLIRGTFENMKKAIKSWGKYVPWPVVQLLLRTDAEASINVSEREVSIYFSDIQSFTTIVENLPPEQSLLLLSRYFYDMSKIIDDYSGIVLEFIGDAIMAVFGAPIGNPDHATAAVRASLRMLARLKVMNQWFVQKSLPQVNIRCGVHTGTCLVGNMGFQNRMKYGVVGEETNVPGRLEESNKNYSTEMLVSQATCSNLQAEFFYTRPIDIIYLHGEFEREAPQMVYQVMERNSKDANLQARRNAAMEHTAAMELWKEKAFTAAAEKFKKANDIFQELNGAPDPPAQLMIQRCKSYIEDPPPASWDGVWDREGKA